jgi:hypothetical protein
MKVKGLDDFSKKLDDLARKADELDGEHNIPLNELLTPTFLSGHTRFSSVDEMIEASGFKVDSQEDFAAIPDAEWDEFIRSVSSFSNWQEMLSAATQEWAAKKLGF